MKTKLVLPAFWTCITPYICLPSLTTFLRLHGKDVELLVQKSILTFSTTVL